jgi:signal transduction histidine kinase
VKGIAESVGGRVEFQSILGQETVFRVMLPHGSAV